jgi:hypothetical protein
MGFCCGASMLGAIGTVKYKKTLIHQVPIIYCPICRSFDVYPKIRDEYEILAEYAHADRAGEVTFSDYVDLSDKEDLFEDCINYDGSSENAIRLQIDHALDLLVVAKKLGDEEWKNDLLKRLKILSRRLPSEHRSSTN